MAKKVLVDLTRCIGCRGCQSACKEWNQRSTIKTTMYGVYTNPIKLNSECYTRIRFLEEEGENGPVWNFVKDQCMHCLDPACASACPVGALKKTDLGPVVYYSDPCIGCRYCMLACPFHIPKYEWEKTSPAVQKCNFCSDRISDGLQPSCVKACPSGTLFFGEQDEVMSEIKRRRDKYPGRYIDHIYGFEEAGGTSWLYLSDIPFEQLGFNTTVPKSQLPDLTWQYIKGVPAMLGITLVAGIGCWLVTRRNQLADKEGSDE